VSSAACRGCARRTGFEASRLPPPRRAAGKDENTILTPPLRLPLERALSYIEGDELLEVTPKSIRLRKRWLDPNERKKRERAGAAAT